MEQISIKKEIFYEMLSHCLREGPLEACGFLSGAGEIIEKMHKMKPLNDAAASFNPSETCTLTVYSPSAAGDSQRTDAPSDPAGNVPKSADHKYVRSSFFASVA